MPAARRAARRAVLVLMLTAQAIAARTRTLATPATARAMRTRNLLCGLEGDGVEHVTEKVVGGLERSEQHVTRAKRHETVAQRRRRATVHVATERATDTRADLDEPLGRRPSEVDKMPVGRNRRSLLLQVVSHAEPAQVKVFRLVHRTVAGHVHGRARRAVPATPVAVPPRRPSRVLEKVWVSRVANTASATPGHVRACVRVGACGCTCGYVYE
jgi:hypothetical protein